MDINVKNMKPAELYAKAVEMEKHNIEDTEDMNGPRAFTVD